MPMKAPARAPAAKAAPKKKYAGKPRGFAAMHPTRVKEIATMGGNAHSPKHMAKIGKKGGKSSNGGHGKAVNGQARKSR